MHALECGPGCTSWICNKWTAGVMAATHLCRTSHSYLLKHTFCFPMDISDALFGVLASRGKVELVSILSR